MRHLFAIFILGFSQLAHTQEIKNPVVDYLHAETEPTFVVYRTDRNYYSDDYIIRLDLDLNKDGTKEAMVTSSRDRDGRQGNVWMLYQNRGGNFERVGTMTFSPSRFYIGALDGGKYGLATFGPAGAGEGTVWGYVFDGNRIQQIALGNVVLDRKTMKLEGEEIISKYLGENAILGEDVVTSIGAAELAAKYGVTIDPRTYQQALAEETSVSPSVEQPKPSPTAAETTPVPPTTTPVQKQKPQPSPTVAETKSAPPGFPIVPVSIVAAVIAGIIILILRRKS